MAKVNKEKEIKLTIERLKYLISYNKETNEFTWLVAISNNINAGQAVAGAMIVRNDRLTIK